MRSTQSYAILAALSLVTMQGAPDETASRSWTCISSPR